MKLQLNKLGGQLGLLFCLAGLILVWIGWNGAASYTRVDKQFPYLLSGGIAGLALVIIGVGLFVVQSQRADRVQLEANLTELRLILDRMTGGAVGNGASEGSGNLVVAGPTTYHRPNCHLVEGREGVKTMSAAAAQANGLSPCRTCGAPAGGEVDGGSTQPTTQSVSGRRGP